MSQDPKDAEIARLRAENEALKRGTVKPGLEAFQSKPFSPGSATDPRAAAGVHTAENPGAPQTNPPAREVWPGGAGSYQQKVESGHYPEA